MLRWILLPKTLTHTEPEVLLDGEKRVGKMADLPEDMVVRGSIVFEYPVQVESQYMMEEAAAICRLKEDWCVMRAGCPGTRSMKMPPTHISSQNSYDPNTYLCALQRLSLPQDSDVNDFIFGLLNRRGQGKKVQVSDSCQDPRHQNLPSALCHDPVGRVPLQNTFTL